MAKMKIAPPERAKVKAECLRLLVTLKLDPARMNLISGFVDNYLNLNPAEEREFEQEISIFRQEEQEEIMEITTSWMRKGIEQGIKQGIEQGQRENLHANIISILEKRFETVPSELSLQINSLEDVTKLQQLLLETISVNSLTEFQSLI